MPHDRPPSNPFARAIDRPDSLINLAQAALLIARDEYPDLDVDQYLTKLDEMSEMVRPRVETAGNSDEIIDVLNEYLIGELGFAGNHEDYYNPRNSFLNEVIDRRTGIPITLSVIYIELGRRLGLPIHGIGLPGHFIVRYDGASPAFIDPFNGGERLTEADCQQRLHEIFGGPVSLRSAWLVPVSNRQILTRILYNLKGIYVRDEEFRRAIPVVKKILILNPDAHQELRDLGSLHGMLGDYGEALIYLQQYLVHRPHAPDAEAVQSHMKRLMSQIARWN
ncbi:MAG: hypothetical protein D6791_14230 [Chloroflexi bacterium]|nr:MAG: hypothetical protein D6791_14230 [Chloroflexota bacterium]